MEKYERQKPYKVQREKGSEYWALFDNMRCEWASPWLKGDDFRRVEEKYAGPGESLKTLEIASALDLIEMKLEENYELEEEYDTLDF